MDLAGKVAIVTGASSGIGEATARELARAGVRVALAARRVERLERLAAELNADEPGPRALVVPTDVHDQQAVQRLVQRTTEAWGQVDVLVNNAGVGMYAGLEDATIESQRYVMDVNYWGSIYAAHAVAPQMRARASGTIVTVSSIVAKHAVPYQGPYVVTKYALSAASDTLRMEMAGSGIRVITILPGVTFTEFQSSSLLQGRRPPPRVMAGGAQPAQTARAIVKAIRRGGPPEVYVTLFDQVYVTIATLFPRLSDRILLFVARRRWLS